MKRARVKCNDLLQKNKQEHICTGTFINDKSKNTSYTRCLKLKLTHK